MANATHSQKETEMKKAKTKKTTTEPKRLLTLAEYEARHPDKAPPKATPKPPADGLLPSERMGVPPTTPDVDQKVAKAKKASGGRKAGRTAAAHTTKATKPGSGDVGERGAAAGHPAQTAEAKPLSLIKAAVVVLARAGRPMGCVDIVDDAMALDLWQAHRGKTPAATLYAAILREIKAKGMAARFVKAARGKFALNDTAKVAEEQQFRSETAPQL